MKKIIFILIVLSGIFFKTQAISAPLCSTGTHEEQTVSGNANWIFYVCNTLPEIFKVRIASISLLDSYSTPTVIYTNSDVSLSGWTDLVSGVSDIASNITPAEGTWSKLRITLDRDWYIKASSITTYNGPTIASGSMSVGSLTNGVTELTCKTKINSNALANTSLTGDGHGAFLDNSNSASEEMRFRHNAFNFEVSGGTGSNNQVDGFGNTYPYFSKMTYTINANNISTIEHYMVDSAGTLTTLSSNVTGANIDINFADPITISNNTNQTYTLDFDVSKGVAFAHYYKSSGNYYNDGKCNFLSIGMIPITLTIE
jgi:hypothetical protein